MEDSVYGKDDSLKQRTELDICPKCTIETMKFLGVPRKRTRKAAPEEAGPNGWLADEDEESVEATESERRARETLARTGAELDAAIKGCRLHPEQPDHEHDEEGCCIVEEPSSEKE